MPISKEEFIQKTAAQLDVRHSKLEDWTENFLANFKDQAFTPAEVAAKVPKTLSDAKSLTASINGQLAKLVVKGKAVKKGSYYIAAQKDVPPTTDKLDKKGRPAK